MREVQKKYIRELYQQILDAEHVMQDKPLPKLTKEDFLLFYKTGNRLVYENAYFGRRKYLTVYAVLSLWSRKLAEQKLIEDSKDIVIEDYIEHLKEVLMSICQEQFWALPAHVDFEKVNQPDAELVIDLFAAETAQALSEIILYLYDCLPCEVVACVAREVIRRVLLPFATSAFPYSWWETDRCNWSAVCAGAIGMTAINIEALNHKIMAEYMPDDRAKDALVALDVLLYRDYYRRLPVHWKADCLKRVCDSLGCYLDGMEEDGACTEGLGYYNYGMSFYTAFAEKYNTEQLMYQKKCEQIALFQQKCYFGKGVSISFSDGSKHESFLPGLTAYLQHCYPQIETPSYILARPFDEDACYRYLTNERNIRWLMQYADSDNQKEEIEKDWDITQKEQSGRDNLTAYLLPEAQWLICQDKNGNGFAAKGGNNNENHNHNDIGHFLCVYNGEMLLTDLGAGEYTKDYFSEKRYDILCNRSMGHSVPVINGKEQCAGEAYRADSFVWDEREHMLTISFASAYPKGSVSQLVRHIKMCGRLPIKIDNIEETNFQKKPQFEMQIEVQDLFTVNENTRSIVENLVTEYEPVIQDKIVWVKGQHGQCSIQVENCYKNAIKICSCVHSDHAGNCQTVYRIMWDVTVENCSSVYCKMWITFYNSKTIE